MDRATPAPFAEATGPLGGAVSIAAGGLHTCVVGAAGIFCAGAGDSGQLGDGASMDRSPSVAARVTCP
jgi:hypothetical protein